VSSCLALRCVWSGGSLVVLGSLCQYVLPPGSPATVASFYCLVSIQTLELEFHINSHSKFGCSCVSRINWGCEQTMLRFLDKHLLMLVVEGRPMLQQVVTLFRDQLQSACDANAVPCHGTMIYLSIHPSVRHL